MTPPIGDKPWLPEAAIGWLDRTIRSDWRIFEWGAGGSTLWFANRARSVRSVEQDADWAAAVLRRAKELRLRNIMVQHIPCEHEVVPFDAYAAAIMQHLLSFNLIVIDGCNGSRLACAHRAVTKIKPGGYILLDNNEASAHLDARDYLDGVYPLAERWADDVYALTPAHAGRPETSVWKADGF